MTGSPKITETILEKIDASHLFISDITIINSTLFNKFLKRRLTPNPNVLFELGYALNRLSWDRIICLNNDYFSKIGDMPFDLQQNRISRYSFNGKDKKDKAKKQLTDLLKTAIRGIIDNNDVLQAKEHQRNVHQHDINLFKGLDEILDDTIFLSLLEFIASNQILSKDEYRSLDNFNKYLKADKNQFLITDLNNAAMKLQVIINEMLMTLSTTLQLKYDIWYDDLEKCEKTQSFFNLPDNEKYFDTYQKYESDKDSRISRNNKAISDAIDSYKKFRATIKRHLFI
jgi:hypothetical protein